MERGRCGFPGGPSGRQENVGRTTKLSKELALKCPAPLSHLSYLENIPHFPSQIHNDITMV